MFPRTEFFSSKKYLLIVVCMAFILAACGGSGGGVGGSLTLSGEVTTLAGSTGGYMDATGTAAKFYFPYGITTDGNNLYVADSSNNRIRQIVIATGAVTTLAGDGNFGYLDATGTAASFNIPYGITTNGTNLYVADTFNHRIRQIAIATGVVTTIAGDGTQGALDDTGTAAQFFRPIGVTTDGINLYVVDSSNHRIRQIAIATGVVTTIAGSTIGYLDGTGTAARFTFPTGVSTDGTNLYVADGTNNFIRQIVISTGEVTTIAGSTVGNLDGPGTVAQFYAPSGITTDGNNLYVVDKNNHRIRQIQ